MAKSITNSQLDKAVAVLRELAINVTTDDRKDAATELKVHPITVSRYLNGTGTDLDTAISLIQFFKKRISDREKVIAA
jgi:hypothetical protein